MFPFFNHYPGTDLHEIDLAYILKLCAELRASNTTLTEWKAEHEQEYEDLANKVDGLINNLVDVISPWDSSIAYHIFSIVEYQGTNYIAVQDVPVGAMITNTDYWQPANTAMEQINAIGVTVDLLKSLKISAYENVAEMKADTDIEAGHFALTYGYYSVDDGGGALYYIEENAPSTYSELLDNNLYAELISDQNVNIKQYGAVGNDVTDDTAAINAAVADAIAKNINTIYFPCGTYLMTAPFNNFESLSIYGDLTNNPIPKASDTTRMTGTRIHYTGDTEHYLISCTGHGNHIRNMSFVGDDNTNYCLDIRPSSGWENYVENCTFSHFKRAILISGNDNRLTGIVVSECGDKVVSASDTPVYAVTGNGLQNYISNSHFEHCRYMVECISNSGTNFENCKFEQSTYYVNSPNLSSPVKFAPRTSVNNCQFVTLGIEGYLLQGISAANVPYMITGTLVLFDSCYLTAGNGSGDYTYTTSYTAKGRFLNADRCVFNSCVIERFTRQAAAFAFNNGSVIGNMFYLSTGNEGGNAETARIDIDLDTIEFIGNSETQNAALTLIFTFDKTAYSTKTVYNALESLTDAMNNVHGVKFSGAVSSGTLKTAIAEALTSLVNNNKIKTGTPTVVSMTMSGGVAASLTGTLIATATAIRFILGNENSIYSGVYARATGTINTMRQCTTTIVS